MKGLLRIILACLAAFLLCPQCPEDSKEEEDITCIDVDGDGYGRFCGAGFDCRDDDVEHWSDCLTCLDEDGDGYYDGCDTYISTYGPDCDDSDVDNWFSCDLCLDTDNDGAFSGCDVYVERIEDCNDENTDNWKSCLGCKDEDGDTWYSGCDRYVSRNGPDCDDSDVIFDNCDYCVDNDNDGYWVDAMCSGVLTGDCEDQDPDINPGEVEICGNGIDQNCDSEDREDYPDGVPCYTCAAFCDPSDFTPFCVAKYGTGEYCYEVNACFSGINCEVVICTLPLDEFFMPDPDSPCAQQHQGCADPCSPI